MRCPSMRPTIIGRRVLQPRSYFTSRGKVSEPLRVLFCGSDTFSTESLHALHEEWTYNRELIKEIQVAVQPPKYAGRGLKQKAEVPCRRVADELGLATHEIDTFRDWHLPKGINIIIAVSFGLFVPPRLLRAVQYGGLNVHPSFLPDLRGPAPIHHAVLRGDKYMGVSLQTMDDKKFDHGTILAQTPSPGLRIMESPTLTRATRKLAMEGAELLVQGLRDGVHVPPYVDAGWKAQDMEAKGQTGTLQHAPKITKEDTKVDWFSWTADDWRRRLRMSRAVWTMAVTPGAEDRQPMRIIFHDAVEVRPEEVEGRRATLEVAKHDKEGRLLREVVVDAKEGAVYVLLREDTWIRVRRATLEGKPERAAAPSVRGLVTWNEAA